MSEDFNPNEAVTLPRSGRLPLRFTGSLLAEQDGHTQADRQQSRWYELAIYQTTAGQLVAVRSYRSRWQGEVGRDEAELCSTPEAVEAFFRDHDPASPVAGFPTGDAYAERQARLLADVRLRYEEQVSALLQEADLAEEIE